jgi:hypothetical protein
VCPELAAEIGLNESILLLQLEFWIRTSTTVEHEGRQWTYQSVRDIQKTFKFWSIATINRTIKRLIDNGYIIVGNFNKQKYDRTRWFALNYEKLRELKSIRIVELLDRGVDTRSNQNETRSNQNDTHSVQNETTIPETTTETTTDIYNNTPRVHKKRTRAAGETDPRIKRLIDYYHDRFVDKFGEKPVIDGGKDGAIIKKLLGTYSEEKIRELIDAFFESDDPFITRSGYTIGCLKTQVNKLLVQTKKRPQETKIQQKPEEVPWYLRESTGQPKLDFRLVEALKEALGDGGAD